MKTIAIVQARTSSKRLPEKVLKKINGVPVIGLLCQRLEKSSCVSQIVVATTEDTSDDALTDYLCSIDIDVFRGETNNVLARFISCAEKYQADTVIRITGDCPLVDASIVDEMHERFILDNPDYMSNAIDPTFPDGLDVEIFSVKSLVRSSYGRVLSNAELEHVTIHLRESGRFKVSEFRAPKDHSNLRLTLDTDEDLKVIRSVFKNFYPNFFFSLNEIIKLENEQPKIFAWNSHISRNAGMITSDGQKLYGRAKQVILHGSMLLSKNPDLFAPRVWPSYFSKTEGCKVWDLDGNEYLDCALMGVGTNVLGYSNPIVDSKVREVVMNGNLSTLNCPEEVYLAERLLDLHKWADRVKFSRSGGEANAIAIRIARNSSRSNKVAVCGYHGWHDWYLSANINSDTNLDEHLIPGLSPKGVPVEMAGLTFPFKYNDFETVKDLVFDKGVGIIKMEVQRNVPPEDDFLSKVRKLADQNNVVLIFDECTSGFRETFGGLHLKYDVCPDIAIFGKTLGNGYAINAVLGNEAVMESASGSFISSTFWTERIGPTAGLASLSEMEKIKSWEYVTKLGKKIKKGWRDLAKANGLEIKTAGLDALASFSFTSGEHAAYKTLITQDMLNKGFLATNSFYASTSHNDDHLASYFSALADVFSKIKRIEEGEPISNYLRIPESRNSFGRLN